MGYMVIGGLAVVMRGFPRHTDDIDATTMGADTDPQRLYDALRGSGFEARIDGAIDFARQHQVLLMRHTEAEVDLDVSLAWLPFEEQALDRAES